jgi:hypothetical protein
MPAGIVDRDADVWEPLLAVADEAGEDWPAKARVSSVSLVSDSKAGTPSLGVQLLADLQKVFADDAKLTTLSILDRLHHLPESIWADMRGKPLDESGLARRLKPYGIAPKQIRMGTATPRGYVRADLLDAWARYLSPTPEEAKTGKTGKTEPAKASQEAVGVLDVLGVLPPQGVGEEWGGL